ncbi:MAG TPA: HAD family hydrolase [Solirubrobacteraceae bacterium]|nr:HAD family hydrolase [Solirubrobacteraceae bacterium]
MPPGRAVELVLFDFGGTLFHPAPAERLLAAATRSLGLSFPADRLERLGEAYAAAGIPGGPVPPIPAELQDAYDVRDLGQAEHRIAWVGMLSRAEIPADIRVPDPGALADAVYDQTLDPRQWVPYADAAPTLSTLAARGIATGLISNIGFDLREILYAHDFGALADTATLSLEVGVMKPDPRIFSAALRRFGADPGATVMVGDTAESDGGASALGMTTLILPLTPPGSVHGLARVLELVDGLEA